MSLHRITFVITDLEPGGAERQLVELATRLPRDEFEPSLVVLFPPPRLGELPERLEKVGVAVEYLGMTGKWQFPNAVARLTHRMEETRPDVVQCFLHHANLVGSLACRRAGIERVVTGIRVAERRWNLHRTAARLTDRYVTLHVCVSQAVADFAASRMNLSRSKLVVIPNGVDTSHYAAAAPLPVTDLGLHSESNMLVYVGRLDRQKRLDWLLLRTADLVGRLPNHHLVLVGQGPHENRLKGMAFALGISDRVHFAGWRRDVPFILALADMLVFTSAWEGMPNVVLEAMATGKPVVATEVEGLAEILGPLAEVPARQLVGRDDANAFIESVVRLASDASLSRDVGAANRSRVEQEFTMERMVHRYCELYRNLL